MNNPLNCNNHYSDRENRFGSTDEICWNSPGFKSRIARGKSLFRPKRGIGRVMSSQSERTFMPRSLAEGLDKINRIYAICCYPKIIAANRFS
jgi:hypothetical protein